MNLDPLLVVGAGTLLGASGVIAFNVVRARREAARVARRDQLLSMARRAGLEYVGERPRVEDLEAARWFRGAEHEVRTDSFLQGQDRNGRYWLARRTVMGLTQEVIGFQIRGELNVGRGYIEPTVPPVSNSGTSWMTRFFSRPAPPPATVERWTIHREATPQQIDDEIARHSIDRWVARLVPRAKNESRVPVGLEVRDGLGWIYSTRPLEGARLMDFLGYALDLRGAVLQEVQRRPATISTAVNTVTGVSDRRSREATAPLFAVEVAEGADVSEEGKTIVLSAEDLLREPPVQQTSKRRKVRKFEIPEPEEDVQVIGTWGR